MGGIPLSSVVASVIRDTLDTRAAESRAEMYKREKRVFHTAPRHNCPPSSDATTHNTSSLTRLTTYLLKCAVWHVSRLNLPRGNARRKRGCKLAHKNLFLFFFFWRETEASPVFDMLLTARGTGVYIYSRGVKKGVEGVVIYRCDV